MSIVANSRLRLILMRWLSLLAMGFVAGAIFLLFVAWAWNDISALIYMPSWAFVALGILLAVHVIRAIWNRPVAYLGFRHFVFYPPVWVSSFVGVLFLCGIFAYSGAARDHFAMPHVWADRFHELLLWEWLILSLAFISSALASIRICRAISPVASFGLDPQSPLAGQIRKSFPSIKMWLIDDTQVKRKEDDAFGHWRIACRIAERLVVSGEPPAQAVVGRLGTGKTTLCRLVEDALHSAGPTGRMIEIVRVELWPYESSRAAVEGVIRALIDALSKRVNTLELTGVPESYVAAMGDAGGLWSVIARLLQPTRFSPFDSLKRIDEIATAIGRRYVLWIEDLERFAGTPDESSGGESAEASARLCPIRALLFGLDRYESITVITATTSLHARFDLSKIARYVETIPELPERHVSEILSAFRIGCIVEHPIIDPASPSARKELDELGDGGHLELVRALVGSGLHSIKDALPVLCSTPRVLKQGLRSCYETWHALRGEVDFDDLLVMSLLREARPNLFALIEEHVAYLRRRGGGWSPDTTVKSRGEWEAALKAAALDPINLQLVDIISAYVFDAPAASDRPQGFAALDFTDYWQRFLTVPRIPESERDQTVLRKLHANSDEPILAMIEHEEQSRKIEQFARQIETDRLVRIFRKIILRRSKERPSQWPGWPEANAPGILSVWRLLLRRSERGELSALSALEEIKAAYCILVPRNLPLVAEIEHYFVMADPRVHNLLRDQTTAYNAEAKRYLRDLLATTFSGKPDELASALTDAKGPTLLWLCLGLDRVHDRDFDKVPFEGWTEFRDTILAASRKHPKVMLHQLAWLVVEHSSVMGNNEFLNRYDFKPDLAVNLFGSVDAVFGVLQGLDRGKWRSNGPANALFQAVNTRENAEVSDSNSD